MRPVRIRHEASQAIVYRSEQARWLPSALAALVLWAAGAAAAGEVAPQDAAIIAKALADAEEQGFAPSEFPSDPAAAAVAYARAQHGGRTPVGLFPHDWAIRPAPYDAEAAFSRAVADGRLATWLAQLPPSDERYGRLVKVYERYRAIAARGGWADLPVGARPKSTPSKNSALKTAVPTTSGLKLGDTGAAVTALRDRLAIEDPAVGLTPPGKDPAGLPLYDEALAAAVRRAQERYGLDPDGIVGAATLTALNVPVEARLAQMRLNLERWRWMPRSLPAYRVELNTAAAELQLSDPAGGAMAMRAIVGRAARPTPMFEDAITAVIFNPPWNVPQDIAVKEIWPKIRRDPGYMAREGFVVRPGGGLQQRPGPKCALGVVKFDLGNPFGVYLHDTPSHGLFALSRRDLSHGCMRLEQPTDLARRLLAGNPAWPQASIDLALLSGKTTRAALATPVPLFVIYWTAFVDEKDQIHFLPDVYGWDEALANLLRTSGRPR